MSTLQVVRREISMSDDEVRTFLHEQHVMQIATCRADGMPHLVTMWYGLLDGSVAFWSYAKAQKIVNLRTDPRIACLIETGSHPSEVRGISIEGTARLLDDPHDVEAVGRAVHLAGFGVEATEDALAAMGVAKRVAAVVVPRRTASWDHRKIPGGYLAGALPTNVR